MDTKAPPAQFLYLFSSITTELYAVDALNSLALPNGWVQHFRYEERHLDSDLWHALPDQSDRDATPNSLEHTNAVICFVNQRKRPEPLKGYEVLGVYPLRLGRITRAMKDGGVAHFWFSVEGHILYDPPDDIGVEKHARALEAALGNRTPYQAVYGALGRPYPIAPVGADKAADAFQSTVKVISGQGFRSDATVFAQFHGLKELEKKKTVKAKAPLSVDPGPLLDESGYAIGDGGIYAIDISTYHTEIPNRYYLRDTSIEMLFDPEHFLALGRTHNTIGGRYDRFSFALAVRRHARDEWTAVTVRGTPGVSRADLDETGEKLLVDFRAVDHSTSDQSSCVAEIRHSTVTRHCGGGGGGRIRRSGASGRD